MCIKSELLWKEQILHKNVYNIYVTSFSSIPYYSNVRLISKMYLEQNSHYITLDHKDAV